MIEDPDEPWPPGVGIWIALAVSLPAWAMLIYGVFYATHH
jgi:hypothetical protein